MLKRTSHLILIALISVMLFACGGGGGGGGVNGGSVPTKDISGIWAINETSASSNCVLAPELDAYKLKAEQNGNDLTIIDNSGNSYSGNISGSNVNWSGDYSDEAPDGTSGRTRLNPMSATIDASCDNLSGSASWTWTATDGSGYSCSGTTKFTGERTPAKGCAEEPVETEDITAPSIPSNLVVIATSSTKISLNWSEATDSVGVINYSVYRNGDFFKTVSANKLIDSALNAGIEYCYTVVANDAAGNKSKSSYEQCATTLTEMSDVQAPTVPNYLTATAASSSQINLNWSASTDNVAVTVYAVYRNSNFIKSVTGTSFSDKNLIASTNYCYSVLAKDAAGNSSVKSTRVCKLTRPPAITVPALPGDISASNITDNSVKISWVDNSDNETGFEIGGCSSLIKHGSTGWVSCLGEINVVARVRAGATTYVITNLDASTRYLFFVRSYNSAGASDDRGVEFTTDATAPVNTTITLYAAMDNLLMRSTVNRNIENTYYNAKENAVGCNWVVTYYGDQNSVCSASLIYFDMAAVRGKNIISATLMLSVDVPPTTLTKYRVEANFKSWGPNVTWKTAPLTYANSNISFMSKYGTSPVSINVTSIVKNWANGAWANYGFMLSPDSFSNPNPGRATISATIFCSREYCGGGRAYYPQVIIEYMQ